MFLSALLQIVYENELISNVNISLFAFFSLYSGWARLAVYMDHIYSIKPLNLTGTPNRESCLSETFSSSDANRRILFA